MTLALGALLSTMGGCAVAPADGERPASTNEAMLVPIPIPPVAPGVELQLQATLSHVQSVVIAGSSAKQQLYLGFHVKNVGANSAVASQVVVNCTPTAGSSPSYQGECALGQPFVLGIPALAPGAFYDFSLPTRGVDIGGLFVTTSQPISFSASVTVQIQSPQLADASIGTVTLTDGCSGSFAACTSNLPAPPPMSSGDYGLLATPFGLGYFDVLSNPTNLTLTASGLLFAGGTATLTGQLTTPDGFAFSVAPDGEVMNILLDGKAAGTYTSGAAGPTPVALPAYDGKTHTLQLTFAGSGSLAPTVSNVVSFKMLQLPHI
jgi:hypothetical protein